jgi:hypothetical protein
MNIKRGFDRIFFVVSIICAIIGFFIGAEKYSQYKEVEIELTPQRICNKKIEKITLEMIKGWHIKPPFDHWFALPSFISIVEGEIAHKKSTNNYWIFKQGYWKKWYPEGSISPTGKYIVQGGKWIETPTTLKEKPLNEKPEDDFIDIDDEVPIGNWKLKSVIFFPPRKNYIFAGSLVAITIFPIILIILMGFSRIVNWIIMGFRDNENRKIGG